MATEGFEWWTKKHQRALDTLADAHFDGFKIRMIGQGGCGTFEPTADPDELNRIAQEIGLDPSYYLVNPSGKMDIPLFREPQEAAKTNGEAEKKLPRCAVRCMADVDAREVMWLWPGYFALGKLTIIAGDPGLGKSYASMDIAARTSSGCGWPTEPSQRYEESSVVILNAEDDAHDTIRPRLDSLEARCKNVFIVDGVIRSKDTDIPAHLTLKDDLRLLEDTIVERSARLVIVDPLSAYLGTIDSHRDSEVRSILSPLRDLAERHMVALVAVMHLNKSQHSNAMQRAIGSVAFGAAARMVWLVCKDPDDGRRRLMVAAKSNLKSQGEGLAFIINEAGQVAWDSTPVTIGANEALAKLSGQEESSGSQIKEAESFLLGILQKGSMDSKEVLSHAVEEGIKEKTLRRAKKKLGIKSLQDKVGHGWRWELLTTN